MAYNKMQEIIIKNILKKNIEGLKSLIHTVDINIKDEHNKSFLHYAIHTENPEIVQLLINNGADINALDDNYRPPISKASVYGDLPIVKVLINNGANINLTDQDGFTPLMFAALKNRYSVLEELLKCENINIHAANKFGKTAYFYGDEKIKQMLTKIQ